MSSSCYSSVHINQRPLKGSAAGGGARAGLYVHVEGVSCRVKG